ncbi:hypothetical protein PHMEG_00030766 [Phytophthora megakarya]|uniref:Tyr recombinase domain-containing protein n=1 Tax=Phytophthora megakarya TaxID=4795 RepID=A0A225UY57_9STRA|nr:hypothetical protein PHMEG_00030766 [Phytophthora megakarya]
MDSSDEGLCILHPAENEYIRVRFDSSELSMIQDNIFSINVREQLSALFAVLCWGELWYSTFDLPLIHVRVWIDNISAVAWCNKLSSSNPLSQEMNRIFGAIEAEWGIRVSAGHLAGSTNFLADLGSRAWSGVLLTQWNNLTSTWTQVQVPSSSRVSSLLLLLFAIDRWTTPPINKNDNTRSYTAIHAQLSHVKWYHRVYAGFEPNINSSHATAFAGMRRLSRPPQQKSPVTIGMLEWIANNIDFEIPQQRLIYGAALLGFYYLLRSSEYLSVKGGRHGYALEVQDVQVLDIAGRPAVNVRDATQSVLIIRGSKTDQEGRGCARRLTRSGHGLVCPVLAAVILLQLADQHALHPTDAICSFSSTRMLKAEELSKVIKAAASASGFDPQNYSCHSLRSGGATALLAGGADSATVKLHGRWRSSTFQRYTHYNDNVGSHLAAVMAGTANIGNTSSARPLS